VDPLLGPYDALRRIAYLLERSRAGTYRVKAFRGAAATVLATDATELRSLTHGRGTFTAVVDSYEEVPAFLAEKVISAHRREAEGGH